MAQQKEIVQMSLTKSTKNTHVYGSSNPTTPIPTLYIKREALPANPPAAIEVTIAFEE